jgi:hypothetical protein
LLKGDDSVKKTTLLSIAILVALACGAAFAAAPPAPAPAGPALAAVLAGPLAGAQYVVINRCEPTINVCVNKQCQCSVTCGSRGVKSFTCDSSTGASTCVCN